jgi:geranylgeranyl diphosphate synthase, type I
VSKDNTKHSDFVSKAAAYKQAIDADIKAYADHVRQTTISQYGEHSAAVTGAYLDMLERGGKRMRGALAMVGYEMCGGTDRQMIVRAATALEMIHAYILIIDDIQDRSKTRRGKPTVHEMLADYHRKLKLPGDASHVGVSLALNAALAGGHAAQMLFAGLSVPDELRTKVLGIVNLTMAITAHGQTADIMNELVGDVTAQQVERALEYKSAHYSILNPLCVGMVLAGVGCEDTDAVRDYSLHTGMAFQISDDIIGVFGEDKETGKSNMDDIREGKRTLLTVYALEHVSSDDKAFLRAQLGNESLTPEDFGRCRQIIEDSGALDYVKKEAVQHIDAALDCLNTHRARWSKEGVAFLEGLASAMQARSS